MEAIADAIIVLAASIFWLSFTQIVIAIYRGK